MRNLRNDKKWCVRVMIVRGRGAASVMQEYGSEWSAVPGGACVTCMTLDCFWSGLGHWSGVPGEEGLGGLGLLQKAVGKLMAESPARATRP